MQNKKYNEKCAECIFLHVGRGHLPGRVDTWRDCLESEDEDPPIAVLQGEQIVQIGNQIEGYSDIVILPAIRINQSTSWGRFLHRTSSAAWARPSTQRTTPKSQTSASVRVLARR